MHSLFVKLLRIRFGIVSNKVPLRRSGNPRLFRVYESFRAPEYYYYDPARKIRVKNLKQITFLSLSYNNGFQNTKSKSEYVYLILYTTISQLKEWVQ